ncbi:MAG: putative glycoside hydrolase [Elusimicrobia bacterium]|nr:putative glycoside hydrolase [Elusimicrobiota bacterium]
MKRSRNVFLFRLISQFPGASAAACALLLCAAAPACSQSPTETKNSTSTTKPPLWGDYPNERPSCVKGIHLTAWFVGSKKGRQKFEPILAETEINTAVIDVKESEGDVYIPGVKLAGKENYVAACPDLKAYVKFLKERGIYCIARVTCFHDEKFAKMRPEWAIHSASPIPLAAAHGYRKDVWVDRKGTGWADATNPEAWNYNIEIAVKAAELGFQEVQFDYIRFPSDGPTKLCVYSRPHNKETAPKYLAEFIQRAHEKLAPMGVRLSIDVFGLTGSTNDDLGIGQKLKQLLSNLEAVSPMMYPSHYYPGEYGLKSPNASPYDTVYHSIRDTKKALAGHPVELRPWLQDFSLGVKYTPARVRDQIEAAADLGVNEWILWNPGCRYTKEALEPFWSEAKAKAQAKSESEGEKTGER